MRAARRTGASKSVIGRALVVVVALAFTSGAATASDAPRWGMSSLVRLGATKMLVGASPDELTRAALECNRQAGAPLCTPENFAVEMRTKDTGTKAVELPTFYLDRTEVARGAYARCVAAGSCSPPLVRLESDVPVDVEARLPVVGVDYDDAVAFCEFVGRRLPSEDEWERAARGSRGRRYPWGDSFHGGRVNAGRLGPERTNRADGYELWAPVDAFFDGRTPEGILQLSGNVAEWTRAVEKDEATSGLAVARGGDFAAPSFRQRATVREVLARQTRRDTLGFRCAADAPPRR